MKLNTLKLTNFRSYSRVNLKFNDNLNIIYGDNGEGKTNLVESIYTLSLTKSFRVSNDKLLIKNGELSTKIEGEIVNDTTNTYEVIINKEGKKVLVNGNISSKVSDYITNINVVILEPNEQTIFESIPSDRRKILNIEISKLKKDYIIYLNNYNKLLKQRNCYLKDSYLNKKTSKEYLDILTKKLVEWGIKIHYLREEFINNINDNINEKYHSVFEKGNLSIKYVSDYKDKNEEEILNLYEKNYERELVMGKTLYGIHHDDIIFLLDDKKIVEYGSNGQKKNAILAFKLSLLEIIKQELKTMPIFILDDLFSALDNQKIDNIINILDSNMQTFITTTDLEKVNKEIVKKAKIFNVYDEKIEVKEYE